MPTDIELLEQQLLEIDTAITKTLLGQEYTYDTGQNKQFVKRANLKDLYAAKYNLQSQIQIAKHKAAGTQTTIGLVHRDRRRFRAAY